MVLEIEKKITEQVEVEVPAWFHDGYAYFYVSENNIMEIRMGQITTWTKTILSSTFNNRLGDALKGKPISEEEFVVEYNKVVESFEYLINTVNA